MIVKQYDLKTDKGNWLGNVFLTDDGKYLSFTDWGNFNFAWNITGIDKFLDFIIGINTDYFAEKMGIVNNSSNTQP